jgi:hypothetical protein
VPSAHPMMAWAQPGRRSCQRISSPSAWERISFKNSRCEYHQYVIRLKLRKTARGVTHPSPPVASGSVIMPPRRRP